jgi:hypothetical protein
MAARAALWMGDLDRARTAAARFASTALPGKLNRIGAMGLEAGLAALEGRRSEAVSGFREARRLLRELGLVVSVADNGLDFVSAVGPADPEARAAADEARATYTRLGAKPWLDRLDTILGEVTPAAAAGS